MKKNFDLSVIILNYNTLELTRACLKTLQDSDLGGYTMEIILCDNASSDGSVDMVRKEFPGVVLIENGKNLGFAAGNNPGIRRAAGRYILLLNTDTEIPRNTLSVMIGFMDENPEVGASTCKILLPDGTMDPACHRGFPTPWASLTYLSGLERLFPKSRLYGQYHQGYKDLSRVHDVDCIVGAFFLVRREVIDQVGLLDEAYFMYAEDIDWAYRIRQAGWRITYNPSVTILHKKKQSGRAHPLRQRRTTTQIYFHTNNWLFFKKHYSKRYGPLISFMVDTVYRTRLFLLQRLGR
jgi:GT2 family glycosyltransferase